MQLEVFQEKLAQALGPSLEHATPLNVREFVDRIQQEIWREEHPSKFGVPVNRIEIRPSKPLTYESVIKTYFARALVANRDQSLIQLWLLALDLAYSGIEEAQSERMDRLFSVDSASDL